MQKFLLIFCFMILSFANVHADEAPIVDIQTNFGIITVQLAPDKAPITVKNFLTYVNEGFYSNTLFHRVIPRFMIQGGGISTALVQKPTHAPIKLESANGLLNVRGTIAMARTNEPDSATSQFFINTVDNSNNFEPPGYAVFGNVINGMEVVDTISAQTTSGSFPVKPVIIHAARVRQAQLAFPDLKPSYAVGDNLQIVAQEEVIQRQQVLDLWVGVIAPDGKIIYFSPENPTFFSGVAKPFKRSVAINETRNVIAEFKIPPGITGKWTLVAIFNAPGSDISNLALSLRSNISVANIEVH